MADEKPNVTVIYQSARSSSPRFGDIVNEVLFVVLLLLLLGPAGCLFRWWL